MPASTTSGATTGLYWIPGTNSEKSGGVNPNGNGYQTMYVSTIKKSFAIILLYNIHVPAVNNC